MSKKRRWRTLPTEDEKTVQSQASIGENAVACADIVVVLIVQFLCLFYFPSFAFDCILETHEFPSQSLHQ